MRLPGRLSGTTLGDLLGALHRAGTSGTLELEENTGAGSGRVHRIELDAGLVSDVDTPLRIARVGELLKERGYFSERTVIALGRLLSASPGRRVGEVLVERTLVSLDVLVSVLEEQRRRRLDALYRLPDALIRFRVPRPRTRHRAAPRVLVPGEFLHGRPRARDVTERSARARAQSSFDGARREALSKLGLSEGADLPAIRRAFRELAAERHPDRFPHAGERQKTALMRQFAELTAAYHLLVA